MADVPCTSLQPFSKFVSKNRDRFFNSSYYAQYAQRLHLKNKLGEARPPPPARTNLLKTKGKFDWQEVVSHLARYPRSLRIEKSAIHGYGLFTGEVVKQGEAIIEVTGQRLTAEGAKTKMAKKTMAHKCLLKAGPTVFIDPDKCTSLARYVNHSCTPNCRLVHNNKVFLVAVREINPNEELTVRYYMGMTNDGQGIKCKCKSSGCRGRMSVDGQDEHASMSRGRSHSNVDRKTFLKDAQKLVPDNDAINALLRKILGVEGQTSSESSDEYEEESYYSEEEAAKGETQKAQKKPLKEVKVEKKPTTSDDKAKAEKKAKPEKKSLQKEDKSKTEKKMAPKEDKQKKAPRKEEKGKPEKSAPEKKPPKDKKPAKVEKARSDTSDDEPAKKPKKDKKPAKVEKARSDTSDEEPAKNPKKDKKPAKVEKARSDTSDEEPVKKPKKAPAPRNEPRQAPKSKPDKKPPPKPEPEPEEEETTEYSDENELTKVFAANLYGEEVVVWGGGRINPDEWTPPSSDVQSD